MTQAFAQTFSQVETRMFLSSSRFFSFPQTFNKTCLNIFVLVRNSCLWWFWFSSWTDRSLSSFVESAYSRQSVDFCDARNRRRLPLRRRGVASSTSTNLSFPDRRTRTWRRRSEIPRRRRFRKTVPWRARGSDQGSDVSGVPVRQPQFSCLAFLVSGIWSEAEGSIIIASSFGFTSS